MAKLATKTMRIPLSAVPEVEALLIKHKIDRLSAQLSPARNELSGKSNTAPVRVSAAVPAADMPYDSNIPPVNDEEWTEEDKRNFMRIPATDRERLRATFGSYHAALDAGHRGKLVNGKWTLA